MSSGLSNVYARAFGHHKVQGVIKLTQEPWVVGGSTDTLEEASRSEGAGMWPAAALGAQAGIVC